MKTAETWQMTKLDFKNWTDEEIEGTMDALISVQNTILRSGGDWLEYPDGALSGIAKLIREVGRFVSLAK